LSISKQAIELMRKVAELEEKRDSAVESKLSEAVETEYSATEEQKQLAEMPSVTPDFSKSDEEILYVSDNIAYVEEAIKTIGLDRLITISCRPSAKVRKGTHTDLEVEISPVGDDEILNIDELLEKNQVKPKDRGHCKEFSMSDINFIINYSNITKKSETEEAEITEFRLVGEDREETYDTFLAEQAMKSTTDTLQEIKTTGNRILVYYSTNRGRIEEIEVFPEIGETITHLDPNNTAYSVLSQKPGIIKLFRNNKVSVHRRHFRDKFKIVGHICEDLIREEDKGIHPPSPMYSNEVREILHSLPVKLTTEGDLEANVTYSTVDASITEVKIAPTQGSAINIENKSRHLRTGLIEQQVGNHYLLLNNRPKIYIFTEKPYTDQQLEDIRKSDEEVPRIAMEILNLFSEFPLVYIFHKYEQAKIIGTVENQALNMATDIATTNIINSFDKLPGKNDLFEQFYREQLKGR